MSHIKYASIKRISFYKGNHLSQTLNVKDQMHLNGINRNTHFNSESWVGIRKALEVC